MDKQVITTVSNLEYLSYIANNIVENNKTIKK